MRHLILLAIIAIFTSCASTEKVQKQPNIILIMADDIGVESIGCYGGLDYKTPKIDKLAKQGVRFKHAYAQPLCTNTRLQLMTGLYNHRNWKYFGILPPEEKTIGHYMQEAGYKTCMVGKWQLQSYDPPDYPGSEKRRGTGMHPEKAGFDEYSLFHSLHTEDKGSRYAKPKYLQNGKIIQKTINEYGPDMWVNYIDKFIDENAEKEDPFFIYYAMALPHWPVQPTPHSKDWQNRKLRLHSDNKYFKDMVEYMDYCVGKIVNKIDSKGLGEETLIIFYSDNGTHLDITSKTKTGNVAGGKGLPTDAGTRVPLIVRWTGNLQPSVSSELTDSTDLLPTCVDVAGSKVDKPIDGISIYPNLKDTKHKLKEHIYCFYDPRPGWDKDQFSRHVFARNKRWKLYESGKLYDIENDVLEKKPIVASSDTAKTKVIRKELQIVLSKMKQALK